MVNNLESSRASDDINCASREASWASRKQINMLQAVQPLGQQENGQPHESREASRTTGGLTLHKTRAASETRSTVASKANQHHNNKPQHGPLHLSNVIYMYISMLCVIRLVFF